MTFPRSGGLLSVVFLVALPAGACRSSPPEPQASPSASATAAPKETLGFLERTTMGAGATDTLPLVVAIHGMGDRPDAFLPPWDDLQVKARIIAPRAPRKYGAGFSWFTYPPKSEASVSREILDAARLVADGIREWSRSRRTAGKAVVTGFSQGGFLAFALAVHFPDLVQAAFPLSGGLPAPLIPEAADARAGPAIFAMHGDADPIVPIAMARTPIARLRALGFQAELREFPHVEHTVNAAMWRELEARVEKTLAP